MDFCCLAGEGLENKDSSDDEVESVRGLKLELEFISFDAGRGEGVLWREDVGSNAEITSLKGGDRWFECKEGESPCSDRRSFVGLSPSFFNGGDEKGIWSRLSVTVWVGTSGESGPGFFGVLSKVGGDDNGSRLLSSLLSSTVITRLVLDFPFLSGATEGSTCVMTKSDSWLSSIPENINQQGVRSLSKIAWSDTNGEAVFFFLLFFSRWLYVLHKKN